MHAPRRLPFEPDEPEWSRASTSAPLMSLIRFVALSVPAAAVAASVLSYLTAGVDLSSAWREQAAVRYLALGLAVWVGVGVAALVFEAVRLGFGVRRE
jgi:hypothetical protein